MRLPDKALRLAGLALLPPLLQRLYGYSVLQSGILTAPRGVGTLISMLAAGKLVGKISNPAAIASISFRAHRG